MQVRRNDRWGMALVLGLTLVGLLAGAGMAQEDTGEAPPVGAQMMALFGLGEFPGGTLHTVFHLRRGGADGAVYTYVMDIYPEGDGYVVVETYTSSPQPADEIGSGGGRSGAAGALGARYDEEQVANIDMSPLQALEERDVILEPNQNYYLPDGARLVTEGRDRIAGVDVVMAIYLHPGYPTQRAVLAFAGEQMGNLLNFPPLMIREVDGDETYRVELIEFSHTP